MAASVLGLICHPFRETNFYSMIRIGLAATCHASICTLLHSVKQGNSENNIWVEPGHPAAGKRDVKSSRGDSICF